MYADMCGEHALFIMHHYKNVWYTRRRKRVVITLGILTLRLMPRWMPPLLLPHRDKKNLDAGVHIQWLS
jgi:hypothetical protein